MKARRIFGWCGAYLVIAITMLFGAGEVRSQAPGVDHTACRKLAIERRRMEIDGVKEHLALSPAEVLSRFGQAGVERVRSYIALSERVLFKCPPNVLNATAAPIEYRVQFLPPPPVKGPMRARRPRPVDRSRQIVPLPVKSPLVRKKPGAFDRPFAIPASQG